MGFKKNPGSLTLAGLLADKESLKDKGIGLIFLSKGIDIKATICHNA